MKNPKNAPIWTPKYSGFFKKGQENKAKCSTLVLDLLDPNLEPKMDLEATSLKRYKFQ